MRYVCALILLLVMASPALAEREALVDLAEDFVPVAQDFDGARVTVFGALQQPRSDIVAVFEGPKARSLVRPKVRQLGIWINGQPQELDNVISFYAVLTSRPLAQIGKDSLWAQLGVGIDRLDLPGQAGEGVRQDRIAKGLYTEQEGVITIRDSKLFRADIQLPPNVPVGLYTARIFEIQKGKVIASRITHFTIAQVGVGGQVKKLARTNPWSYAALSLALVLAVGSVSAYAFRRAC